MLSLKDMIVRKKKRRSASPLLFRARGKSSNHRKRVSVNGGLGTHFANTFADGTSLNWKLPCFTDKLLENQKDVAVCPDKQCSAFALRPGRAHSLWPWEAGWLWVALGVLCLGKA